jgi:hypothetical protein
VEHRDENCTKMELQSSAELEPWVANQIIEAC